MATTRKPKNTISFAPFWMAGLILIWLIVVPTFISGRPGPLDPEEFLLFTVPLETWVRLLGVTFAFTSLVPLFFRLDSISLQSLPFGHLCMFLAGLSLWSQNWGPPVALAAVLVAAILRPATPPQEKPAVPAEEPAADKDLFSDQ